MRRFTELFAAIDATTGTSERTAILAAYFRDAPPEDAAWAVALLSGERIKGAASSAVLRNLVIQESGWPPWLVDECYAATGDLSEAVALLAPGARDPSDEPLHRVIEDRVAPLAGANDERRRRIILGAWSTFDATQRFVYHKLIRGGFRLGVQKRTVARALSEASGVDVTTILDRLAGGFTPTAQAFRALVATSTVDARPETGSRPYPFFLAHQLDEPVESLGSIDRWLIEPKWDGIRAQLVARAGGLALWSRGEEPIAAQFPELIRAARALPVGTVLDGEVLLMRHGRALPFSALQTRLNRVAAPTHQPGLFEREETTFLAFDILERDGVDARARPIRERRAMLADVVERLGPESSIQLCPRIEAETWAEVALVRASSRSAGHEGVMLKHLDSTYGAGRVQPGGSPGWWKWKVDPLSVDAVLIYAQLGSGRRAGLHTDCTFALWDRPLENGDTGGARRLVAFAKAYSGLTQEEIERLDAFVRANTIRRTGPVREVEPVHVFEIGFEAVNESDRHKAGLAVRFPRILRWRTDKPASEADDMGTLRRMLPVSPPE